MKKLALLFCVLAFTPFWAQTSAQGEPEVVEQSPTGVFQFETETIDYGTIEKGANGEREFVFMNVGSEPILITQVKGSCGCTVPTKPEEPIAPGGQGVIKVKYDTKRVGSFHKTVTITSNASESPKTIQIKGKIVSDTES